MALLRIQRKLAHQPIMLASVDAPIRGRLNVTLARRVLTMRHGDGKCPLTWLVAWLLA